MKTTMDGNLSKKDLADRWKVTVRSVERTVKRYQLKPAGYFGRQPEFSADSVERMEGRLLRERMAATAERIEKSSRRIITVKEAKAKAGLKQNMEWPGVVSVKAQRARMRGAK